MRYLQTYESLFDTIRKYLNTYVVIKPANTTDHYLIQIKEEMIDNNLITRRLYTLRKDEYLKKHKKSVYTITPERLEQETIYSSDNLIDAYNVLNSIHDSNNYNL